MENLEVADVRALLLDVHSLLVMLLAGAGTAGDVQRQLILHRDAKTVAALNQLRERCQQLIVILDNRE